MLPVPVASVWPAALPERTGNSTMSATLHQLRRFADVLANAAANFSVSVSDREFEVAYLSAVELLTNREIAQRLALSPKTVEHYKGKLSRKLEYHSQRRMTAELARDYWMAMGADEQRRLLSVEELEPRSSRQGFPISLQPSD